MSSRQKNRAEGDYMREAREVSSYEAKRDLPKANAGESRQTTSIARKIHYAWIWRSFRRTLGLDILMVTLLFTFGILQRIYLTLGTFPRKEIDAFCLTELTRIEAGFWGHVKNVSFYMGDASGKEILSFSAYPLIVVCITLFAVLAVFQILGFLFGYLADERRIRRQLKPLNEIALRADELSKMSFSEDKYQEIEEAISRLEPDKAELLSFGDKDLQGIEAAMNNLLIHMRESYQQQARFVNDASHELRTPIAVIQGYANMLARWGKEDETVLEESITAIQHEADHMKYLVEQLLFLARGDSGRTLLQKEDISLNAMMQELYEESFMIDEKHPYRIRNCEEEITITADPTLIKQAARILIDNAAKYTKEGDEILISYGRTEDGHPYLQIQDSGIGMAENDVAHMFERFYRSDEVRSYQGTGLGLSIAKWIVDKHKGHFEILSREGLGTRIKVIL